MDTVAQPITPIIWRLISAIYLGYIVRLSEKRWGGGRGRRRAENKKKRPVFKTERTKKKMFPG